MGKIALDLQKLEGQRIYIDANVFIYFLEKSPVYFPVVAELLSACAQHHVFAFTGDAAIAEVMAGIYRQDKPALTNQCKAFFGNSQFLSVVNHDAKVFDLAALLVAKQRFKLIDSLHLATALQHSCKALITNDAGMVSVDGLEVLHLQDYL
jgi:predicted nucleic acid-binding protein